MKKNKMMRNAAGLAIVTLITTSVIAGTFAKYTTENSGGDTARAAKWGVTALVAGSLYGENYEAESDTKGNEISAEVKQSVDVSKASGNNKENIVAPGTQNTEGMKIAISGKPEVKNKVVVSNTKVSNEEYKEIFLKTGKYATLVKTDNVTKDNFEEFRPLFTVDNSSGNDSYTLATTFNQDQDGEYYEVHDIVNVTSDYYPITYTLNLGSATTTYTDLDAMYTSIKGFFEGTDGTNNPNVNINKSAVITWKWEFENNDTNTATTNNGADTILGNLIAKDTDQKVVKYDNTTKGGEKATALKEGNDYNLDTDFDIKVTVSQVD